MNEPGLTNSTSTSPLLRTIRNNNLVVFGILWVILFLLYFQAAEGGWVSDDVELLNRLRNGTFWDFINAKLSRGNLYQFSWTFFYVFYRLFHLHSMLWYALAVSLHALNATLLFNICSKLFEASGVRNSFAIAGGGALLFCICPHISEVIIWKAAYHYMHAMLIMLCIVWCVQKFLYAPYH